MKNPLSDLYEQILLSESEKSQLQNPSNDEIGSLDAKQDLFGTKPKPVEGPEKAKLQQGPSYKETTGSAVPSVKSAEGSKSSFKGSAPAKDAKPTAPHEAKNTNVNPSKKEEDDEEDKEHDKNKSKKQKHEESFTMSAFETLFKKTLNEEFNTTNTEEENSSEEMSMETDDNSSPFEENEEENEESEDTEEEGDLVSDLKELQDKLSSILSKLEDVAEEDEDSLEEESYTDEEFDEEFGEDEDEEESSTMKESIDKPKPLATAKGKKLMSKKNKVGKLSAKGGKAHSGSVKSQPNPTALGDKKGKLQKGSHVKSNITKGEFFK